MWVYGVGGFVSVVKHRGMKGVLIVRARSKKDIEYWRERVEVYSIEELTIDETSGTDYRYRFYCERDEFAKAVSDVIQFELNYPNFKNEVAEKVGPVRAAIYGRIWSESLGIENEDALSEEDILEMDDDLFWR